MKRMMITAATGALMALSTTAMAADLKMSHVRPQGTTIDVELNAFAAAVDEATGGDVKVKIYAASALGDYTTVQERISVGAVDMATQPAAAAADRKMQISSFPYLAGNWDQARAIYGPGGVVRETMDGLYANQDITMLAAYPVYFGGIALNTDAVSPGDPSVDNGIKVRVPGIKSFQLTGDALGYIPAPIPFSEAFTAVQTGVVDGVIGSGAEGYYASFRDVTKTYIPANTHFEVWYMIISNESLANLDAEDQDALKAAAAEFEATRWTVAEADQKANEQKLADLGATIVSLSDAELAAMSAKVQAEVWPVVLEDVGVEWGQAILDKVSE
ncbi:TRAP transporter substrate-binding protein DctP [Ruegeria sp. SCP11]|uniref:TRAP transporter substrate-binding protein DctP n=1 Tax=Ruegeria sp. SCP11 TaxID=3141378 RepID=UPI0033392848